ncbi:hypothetical protein DAPPUDRAFT_274895 [Daphnia pulex]|uniref:Uncharacterized protein n=1 Tax=Daphnia pulex TaxID=6669 RepID=E9I4W7_DAPPU|nr:hypothetical protein DAPPUDRAFT_274895 [Daphnia pulex]|eukprot:EFX60963.1 hypothetical protein DAPPUDRAFT_274895 [Daphnia pulex]
MDCTDVEEGYQVRYTPLVPGDYFIAVKMAQRISIYLLTGRPVFNPYHNRWGLLASEVIECEIFLCGFNDYHWGDWAKSVPAKSSDEVA